jgi:hypothetical protein
LKQRRRVTRNEWLGRASIATTSSLHVTRITDSDPTAGLFEIKVVTSFTQWRATVSKANAQLEIEEICGLNVPAAGGWMAITFEIVQISDEPTKARVEKVIRDFIGHRHQSEDWRIWIYSSAAFPGDHYHVVLKGPTQKREQLFFDITTNLDRVILEWLSLYPLP